MATETIFMLPHISRHSYDSFIDLNAQKTQPAFENIAGIPKQESVTHQQPDNLSFTITY